jgi:hypothetical protein
MSDDDYQLNYVDFLKKIGKGLDKIEEDDMVDPSMKDQIDHLKKEIKKNDSGER